MNQRIMQAHQWLMAVTAHLFDRFDSNSTDGGQQREENDRGDVPGWVMITVMTAIVVIAVLGVFREQVVTAVQNAFQSVSGAG
jgi:hypothetical protein